jgi:5,10-methylenetetrahydromethanopterin reductase
VTNEVPAAGLALRDPIGWHDFTQIVGTAEQAGYRSVFLPEILGRDALVTLGALAGETSRLGLATGVMPIGSRRPLVAAMAAATIQERSGGRMILGLGTGPSAPGALDRLRAYVGTVRSLLGGRRVALDDGRSVSLSLRVDPPPEIWISALGPRAMRLAGELADGVLLNWCPPERVAFARERVREAAEAAGRDPARIKVAVYVRACVGTEEDAALAELRRAAAEYAGLPAYRRQFDSVGLGAEAGVAAEVRGTADVERVPETLVRAVCLLGDAPQALRRLQTFREAGADLPVVYPVAALDPVSSLLGTVIALAPAPGFAS